MTYGQLRDVALQQRQLRVDALRHDGPLSTYAFLMRARGYDEVDRWEGQAALELVAAVLVLTVCRAWFFGTDGAVAESVAAAEPANLVDAVLPWLDEARLPDAPEFETSDGRCGLALYEVNQGLDQTHRHLAMGASGAVHWSRLALAANESQHVVDVWCDGEVPF